jgi:hypothetical protein
VVLDQELAVLQIRHGHRVQLEMLGLRDADRAGLEGDLAVVHGLDSKIRSKKTRQYRQALPGLTLERVLAVRGAASSLAGNAWVAIRGHP